MMIKYNDTNVHAIPNIKTKTVKLRNKKTGKVRTEVRLDPSQSPQDIVKLMPGWNEFPRAIWEQNKNQPSIVKMLKDKKIELMDEKVTIKQGKKQVVQVVGQDDEPISLRSFSESRAVEIVDGTFNRDILNRWLDEETRHKVKKALRKQVEPLLNNKEPESE